MAVFSGSRVYFDFSYDLRDKRDWKVAVIREIEYLPEISVFAVDATNGLLAFGSKNGRILVFGSPSAAVVLRVPQAHPVKFLSFATLLFRLICVDNKGKLHVWDLSHLGRPKLIASEAYKESISSVTTSPYHSHAFLGLERGGVVTFDILYLNRSPYVIPNLWKTHEKDTIHGGMLSSPIMNSSDLMEITIHPRDLNLLFVSYTGGVVLYDLTERRPLRYYELIVPPGAPGSFGYYDPDVLKARRPPLTSIAVHASGQLFVTGHLDGTLAFWAVDDEDQPLMVRTTSKIDVNYPEGEELDLALSNPYRPSAEDLEGCRLEPIFKLSWSSFGSQSLSDPYSGDSVLTILGGVLPGQHTGVTVLRLPSLVLPSPSTPSQDRIHPEMRKFLAKSFSSMDKCMYPSVGAVIDFLLVPKESPHFGDNLDPKAILILFEWPEGQRSIDAKEFPPPAFGIAQTPASATPATTSSSNREIDNPLELSSVLESIKLDGNPRDYTESLPSALWTGTHAICDGDFVRIRKEEYESLQRGYQQSNSNVFVQLGRVRITGIAWVDYGDHDQAHDVLFTKRQPHRLLVTHHRDLTVRFQDTTSQLLIGSVSSPLSTSFPAPLPHLTISLSRLLPEPCIANARRPLALSEAEIQSAQLTSESGECVMAMRSGHVFVYGFDGRQRHASSFMDLQDDLIRLVHIPAEADTFQPMVMVENVWGAVTTSEMSDIGFLAIAYDSGALVVVDMRHPRIILRDEVDAKAQKRLSVALRLHNAEDEKRIVSMKWVICGCDEDTTPKVRLLVSHRSGSVRVFTLTQTASREWTVKADVKKLEGSEHPLPRGTFVLQAKTGSSRAASRATFKEALQGGRDPTLAKEEDEKDEGAHCFWVSAGEKGVKCQVNLSSGKAGKAEWGKGRKIECVQVVSRNGAHGLVAVMDSREVIVYSLPALEAIRMYQLFKQPNSVMCLDDTGDFVDWIFDEQTETVIGATLGTFFAIRRVYDEPVIDFTAGRRAAPSMPPPVPLASVGYLGSWFNFKKGKSGDAIDDLLAGPNRSIPQDAETSTIVNSEWQAQMQSRAQAIANQASQTGSNLYANLSAAVSERGEMLNGLQEQFSSLEDGGKKMMLEAKKLAGEQSAKRWFNFS